VKLWTLLPSVIHAFSHLVFLRLLTLSHLSPSGPYPVLIFWGLLAYICASAVVTTAPTFPSQFLNIDVVIASAIFLHFKTKSCSEMIVTRTLTPIPTSGPTCISRLLQRYPLSPGHLTSNVCRKISVFPPTGMDFPAGLSHPKAEVPIVNIEKNSAVYPLGASASSRRSTPSLRFEDCEMVVEEGQAWVVVGTSGAGKDVLLQVSSRSYR